MNKFKFKKGVYIINHERLTETKIDSYEYELYIGKNKKDVKKQYDKCHVEKLKETELENTIKDVTILRICQVLEKLKYMSKSSYFNLQDTTVLNWIENEFKRILKESEQSEDNSKGGKNVTKSHNWWNI